tara:strand:+ start:54 stop:404 length:351 start_codon:yes stop_codon:yes gene_type:complete
MVSPVNFTNSPDNFRPETEFDNGTAIGMPPIHYHNRKTPPISNINNLNTYNPDYNPVRRYNNNSAPSNGSLTEAFLKARITFNPVFMHNEAATRYQMISKLFYSSDDIKNNLLKVA